MRKFSLIMEPALPRTDSELLHFVKEQVEKSSVDKGLLSSILDSFPFAILVFDSHGKIAYVNIKFCELVGDQPKDILGMDIHEFADLYIYSKPYDFSRLPRILAGESITGYNYQLIDCSGNPLSVEFSSYPLSHKTGRGNCCLVMIKKETN